MNDLRKHFCNKRCSTDKFSVVRKIIIVVQNVNMMKAI